MAMGFALQNQCVSYRVAMFFTIGAYIAINNLRFATIGYIAEFIFLKFQFGFGYKKGVQIHADNVNTRGELPTHDDIFAIELCGALVFFNYHWLVIKGGVAAPVVDLFF